MRNVSNRSMELFVRRFLEEQRIDSFPIPVGRIARNLGATLRYEPFDGDISGVVFRDDENIVVGVNSLHHPNRQRFTIAHEIGHILFHKGKEVHIDRPIRVNLRDGVSSQATNTEEIEANRFASTLLLPRHLLFPDLQRQSIELDDEEQLRRLAARYKVSLQALAIRFQNIGILTEVF
jgi:Zn-dependent peptidase ImmA (M78 family)